MARAEVAGGRRRSRGDPTTASAPLRSQAGAVTAEAAVVIPVLLALVLGSVWVVALAVTKVRVVDAAREVARVAARGEAESAAVGHGRRVAPSATRFSVQRAGGRVVVRRDLVVTHLVGGTQTAVGKSDLYLRFNCRNRLLFAAQHLTDDELAGWLRSSPAHARRVLLRGGRRALLRRPVRPAWSVLRGTVEGLLLVRSLRGMRAVRPARRLLEAARS